MIPREPLFDAAGSAAIRRVLEHEIEGMGTAALCLKPGQTESLAPIPGAGRFFLFVENDGVVRTESRTWSVSAPALFIPRPDETVWLKAAGSAPWLGLALDMALNQEERQALNDPLASTWPYARLYSECKTYKEKIKSPKTVSRTLLPAHTYPRLCIGSVETDGPDHVAAHRHPMLEQYFLGLPDNQCRVRADDDTLDFGPNDLLHIPLGSNHSVDVDAGYHLHYIWIDVFRDESGMRWIDEEHEDEP